MRAIALTLLLAACRHAPDKAPHRVATVKRELVHDRAAFTQGLAFWNGRLFEGTGLHGRSSIRELDPQSGVELRHVDVPATYFGEGITVLGGRLYELTWQEHRCLVYDVDTFEKLDELAYDGEGWGLANDGASLVMSDGSAKITFRDPRTMKITRTIDVTYDGAPLVELNELEVIDGVIWANVWRTDSIVRIDKDTGRVIEVLDASAILPRASRSLDPDDVLNGVASDGHGRILVTGKRWPALLELTPR